MRKITLLILILLGAQSAFSQNQNVGINTNTPDASAILEVFSSSRGMLIPRLTTAQRDAIASPANGLLVFDTDQKNIFFYDETNTAWTVVGEPSTGGTALWQMNGSDIYNTNVGFVGIGTDTPERALHLKGDGTENAGLSIDNAAGDYNIIIEIDETNDGFEVIGNDGTLSTTLMYISKDGKVGYNTNNPEKNLQIVGDGVIDPSIALTNNDSTYSVIIEIDETNDMFNITGTDGITSKPLINVGSNGQVGFGTVAPVANLDVKGDNSGGNTAFQLSNNAGDNSIIIEIDETNDGIEFVGNNSGTSYTMFFADDEGKIGIGTTDPQEALHIVSSTANPSIQLTKTGLDYDYKMGFDNATSSFVIKRDSIAGGSDNMIEVNNSGDLVLTSNSVIDLNTPEVAANTLRAELVTIENTALGSSADLLVDVDGNVDVPGYVKPQVSHLDFIVSPATSTFAAPTVSLVRTSNAGPLNFTPTFNTSTTSSEIFLTEAGVYELSYMLALTKPVNDDLQVKVAMLLNDVEEADYVYYYNIKNDGKHTLVMPSRFFITANTTDKIEFEVTAVNPVIGGTQFTVDANTRVSIKKVID